jgi:two-component system KDP operon response regulator KdpE
MRATALKGLTERELRSLTEPVRILVVEHDAGARAVLAMVLRADGAEVTEADDGAAALQAIAIGKMAEPARYFDLVVSDLQLPKSDGVALLALLALAGYRGPIIVLTAPGDETLRARARRSGVTAVLTKPISLAVLRAIVVSATARPWWCDELGTRR